MYLPVEIQVKRVLVTNHECNLDLNGRLVRQVRSEPHLWWHILARAQVWYLLRYMVTCC
jgi:hypothetical protein